MGPVSELGPLHVPQRPASGRTRIAARVQARDTELDVGDGDGAHAALPSVRATRWLRSVMVVSWARFISARARIWWRCGSEAVEGDDQHRLRGAACLGKECFDARVVGGLGHDGVLLFQRTEIGNG